MRQAHAVRLLLIGAALLGVTPFADAMCGYFRRPIIRDIAQPPVLQPSQIAFITWDPAEQIETVTVQPRFEGSAEDFGMVIPTPSQPKLHEMPRDFFKALGVMTQPKKRVYPESKLLPRPIPPRMKGLAGPQRAEAGGKKGGGDADLEEIRTSVKIVEAGQVGNLDYKIITAERADGLFTWLKDNKYGFDGDEATLNYYIQKKYFFTVMKIDTLQMKRNKDGTYTGDVTPTRFSFSSERLVYPLKITQVSVKDKTDALFYVQAPYKVDLPGDLSYQFHWINLLRTVENTMGAGELLPQNRTWLQTVRMNSPELMNRPAQLGFAFPLGQPLPPNQKGHRPSSLEWAKKLTADDIKILTGELPYSETVPDPDFGFTRQDLQDPQRSAAVIKVIQHRVAKARQDKPRGYMVRQASKEDLDTLGVLKGHVQAGQTLTKFYHTFTRDEMNEDLVLVRARVGDVDDDRSEHEEILRTMTFGRRPGGFPLPPTKGPFKQ